MNRVGVITYHDIADGKGRFLQAYALYKAISNLGYDVEIIDYYPVSPDRKNINSSFQKVIKILKNPNCLPAYLGKFRECAIKKIFKSEILRKRIKYELFIRDNIRITEKKYYGFNSILEADLSYDAYVCGSDQIWNPYFQGYDLTYYLRFAPKEKRIAYAPSIGTVEIDYEKKQALRSMIGEIPFVSVREESGAELVTGLIGREVKSVVDPTFLLPKEWWDNFANETVIRKPYLLTFFFDNNSYSRSVAKVLSKRYGLDIVSIPDAFRDYFSFNQKEIGIGPEYFVSLFKNATFVCTQSFHGTVLSLIYNRPFYVFDRETKAYVSGIFSRIRDLLAMVKLEARILKTGENVPENSIEIDFSNSNSILERKSCESLEYLNSSLRQVVGG